jgi:hypothetical protein
MRAYKVWRKEGVCLSGDAQKDFRENSRKSKTHCLNCPVRIDCLNYALLYSESGVWGGTTETDRAQILSVAPQIQKILELEALQAGILEHRYSIEEYFQSLREARKLSRQGEDTSRQIDKAQSVPRWTAALVPFVEEFEALLAEWNTL